MTGGHIGTCIPMHQASQAAQAVGGRASAQMTGQYVRGLSTMLCSLPSCTCVHVHMQRQSCTPVTA